MNKYRTIAAALAVAFMPAGVYAASGDDLQQIRQEVNQLRQAYEARIQELERRLKYAEDTASLAQTIAVQAKALRSKQLPPRAKPRHQPPGQMLSTPIFRWYFRDSIRACRKIRRAIASRISFREAK